MSTNGFVHLHAMYYGGFIPQKWFEETAREAYEDCGFSWLASVEEGDAGGRVGRDARRRHPPELHLDRHPDHAAVGDYRLDP